MAGFWGWYVYRRQPYSFYFARSRKNAGGGSYGLEGVRPGPAASHTAHCRVKSGHGRHVDGDCEAGSKDAEFMSRWNFIIDIDMEKHRDEALQMMEAELK